MLKDFISKTLGAQPIRNTIATYNNDKHAMSNTQTLRPNSPMKAHNKALKLDFHA